MASDLGDPHETRSFLVPAYEFEQGSEAVNFDSSRHVPLGPVNGPEDTYGLVRRDEYHAHPRASGNFLFNAGALFNPSVGESDRPFYVRFQDTPSQKPPGVRSSCLTVEGRRLSPRRLDGRTETVPSFAAWQMPNGGEPPWICRAAYDFEDRGKSRVATKTIGLHWSGQGALCAITPEGVTHLLLVEFHVYDDDPERPDLLKIRASRHLLSPGAMPARGPAGEGLDASWKDLILRTLRGFAEECGA